MNITGWRGGLRPSRTCSKCGKPAPMKGSKMIGGFQGKFLGACCVGRNSQQLKEDSKHDR